MSCRDLGTNVLDVGHFSAVGRGEVPFLFGILESLERVKRVGYALSGYVEVLVECCELPRSKKQNLMVK